MLQRIAVLNLLAATVLFAACGRKQRSDRDTRRDQIRANAEAKRAELIPVVGDYFGDLIVNDGPTQSILLHLEIKDVPQAEDGQIDPVLVPRMAGYVRFNYGAEDNTVIGFGVDNGEYDPSTRRLNLQTQNSEFQELLLNLSHSDNRLNGDWTASHVGASGTVALTQGQERLTQPGSILHGSYLGVAEWPDPLYQDAEMVLKAAPKPPDSITLSATLKLFRGARSDAEYTTYEFVEAAYNPISGATTLRSDSAAVSVSATVGNDGLIGTWSSTSLGPMGKICLARQGCIASADRNRLGSIRGTYQGAIVSTHPDTNLPERLQIGLVTTIDGAVAHGITVTGGMRLYLGEFGSDEFVPLTFSELAFNPYTLHLTAKTTGQYVLTVKATQVGSTISGQLIHESLGQIGTFEVHRL